LLPRPDKPDGSTWRWGRLAARGLLHGSEWFLARHEMTHGNLLAIRHCVRTFT
jgi:hypothetical protein